MYNMVDWSTMLYANNRKNWKRHWYGTTYSYTIMYFCTLLILMLAVGNGIFDNWWVRIIFPSIIDHHNVATWSAVEMAIDRFADNNGTSLLTTISNYLQIIPAVLRPDQV